MGSKKWYKSKGVWLGILTFTVGAIEVVQSLIINDDFSTLGILTAVAGIAKVAERVFRSDSSITM